MNTKTALRMFTAGCLSLIGIAAIGQSTPTNAPTQSSTVVPNRITQPVDETKLVRLRGNVHPMARAEFDRGQVSAALPMERVVLLLQRSPEQEAALEAFMARQLDPKSPDFHHWLEPVEFGEIYGPSEADITAVTNWLQNQGFTVDKVSNGHVFIEFSGTAGLVQKAFHTEIHNYNVKGEQHIANNSDPSIPESLSPVVAGIVSLHNFFAKPLHIDVGSFRRNSKTGKWKSLSEGVGPRPLFGVPSTSPSYELVSPYDFATIYNVLPLWTAGIDGTGETVAIAGRSDISLTDVANFRSAFGLPAKAPTIITNGPDPGVPSTDDKVENTLDVEWSGAVAKGATIKFVTTASTSTSDGAQASAQYIIDNKTAYIMSFSYGNCELDFGTAGNAAYNSMWQQGASEGISEFVASGDQGSAACDGGQSAPYAAEKGLAVSATSSTPYDVAVGGTDFTWANSTTTYWSATNNATTGASALGYIPEVPWNATCASYDVDLLYGFIGAGYDEEQSCEYMLENDFDIGFVNVIGGTGGKSSCTTPTSTTVASCAGGYAKPSWQTGTGVPADGKRDVPDVSLFASNLPLDSAYVICDSDLSPCTFSDESDAIAQSVGGTSVASPAMAGIMALVLQKSGGTAQGLPNPVFYELAAKDTLTACNSTTVAGGNTCNFYDITTDNNAVPCAPGDPNCTVIHTGDEVGILSGYTSTTGYDLATGLGSVNANNMVNAYAALTSSTAVLNTPSPGTTLGTTNVKFAWSAGVGATAYELFLGTNGKGSSNLYHSGSTTATTVTVPSIPADLMTVYAYLCSDIGGAEKCNSYTYKEGGTPTPAVLQTPTQGSTLGTTNVKFTWSAGVGATAYELFLGTEGTGSSNLYHSGKTTATTVTVPSIPADLSTVYAYLCSEIGTQKCTSATYKEGGTPTPAVIETPTQGSTLGTTDVSFTWNTGVGVAQYELFLGTSGPGSSNLYYSGKTTDTTVTVPSLPSTGATVYAYFCSEISGSWKCADYTYKEQ